MKAQLFIFTIAIAMAMTSCQEDGLTGNVLPTDDNVHGLAVSARGSDAAETIPLDFEETVYLQTRLMDVSETRNMTRVIKPQIWSITGYGDSEIENWGSWRVDLNLEYNTGTDAITGTIKFSYPDYGDEVTLVVYGGPVLERRNDDNDHLTMKLALKEATGRFVKKRFEGGASIALTKAWQDNGSMITTLVATGVFIDNGQ